MMASLAMLVVVGDILVSICATTVDVKSNHSRTALPTFSTSRGSTAEFESSDTQPRII
jgi:hypothetical protein